MGYRHQLFVVANVRGAYRTLAVAHCQNKGDAEVVEACWRLLNIFTASANQALIRHDLEHAARQGDSRWISRFPKDEVICPFIETCLILGAACDSLHESLFFYPVKPYPRHSTPMRNLNNNQAGSTIIDLTDQGDPKPLTITEYFEWPYLSRYKIPEVDLSSWRMVTADILHEVWPDLPWPSPSSPIAPKADQVGRKRKRSETDNIIEPTGARSLVDITLQALLEIRLDETQLAALEQLWHFFDRLHSLLCTLPSCSRLPSAVDLLRLAISRAGYTSLDFSPYSRLTQEVILDVLRSMEANARLQIESIDLSGVKAVDPSILQELIELCPRVTTLCLMHPHQKRMSLKNVSKALAGKQQVHFYHSELFQSNFGLDPAETWPESLNSKVASIPNHAASSGTLHQIMYLSTRQDILENDPLRLPSGGLKWSQLSPDTRYPHPLNREAFYCTMVRLQDAYLNPSRFGTWFPRLLRFFSTSSATLDLRTRREGHTTMACACALAIDARHLGMRI
ncbi:hypothetical protein GQ53DRAFT_770995 [Thozetella sp. PMI_491]|nr:hypothetical protein GQ53DRAFT_770995 [Thozetella sp. PMI_491]